MGLVKNIGSKLDAKIKSGEIKESEILQEASALMEKMKEMPGMGDNAVTFGENGNGWEREGEYGRFSEPHAEWHQACSDERANASQACS